MAFADFKLPDKYQITLQFFGILKELKITNMWSYPETAHNAIIFFERYISFTDKFKS